MGISRSIVCILYDYFSINHRSHFQQIFANRKWTAKNKVRKAHFDANLSQKAFIPWMEVNAALMETLILPVSEELKNSPV